MNLPLGTTAWSSQAPKPIAEQSKRRERRNGLSRRGEANTGRHLIKRESGAREGSELEDTCEEFTTRPMGVSLPEGVRRDGRVSQSDQTSVTGHEIIDKERISIC
jgi:hypothetical protein